MAPDDLRLERISPQLVEKLLVLADGRHQAASEIQKSGSGTPVALKSEPQTPSDKQQAQQELDMADKSQNYQDDQHAKAPVLAAKGSSKFHCYGACGPARPVGVATLEASLGIGSGKLEQARLDKSLSHDTSSANEQFVTVPLGDSQKVKRPAPEGDWENKPQPSDDEKSCFVRRLAKIIPCLGILMSLCASFFLGTAGMLVKLTTSVHGIEVAVFRALIQAIIYSSILSVRSVGWVPRRGELIPVAMRATLGGMSITFSYYALKLIPLGDATTIRFSLPVWTLIMSYFFLHESCSGFKIAAVLISISGVVLVTKPDQCVAWFYELLHLLHLSPGQEAASALYNWQSKQAIEDIEPTALMVESPMSQHLQAASSLSRGNCSLAITNGPAYSSTTSLRDQESSQLLVGATLDPLRQFEGCMMALAASICLSISIIALRLCKQTPSEITILWLSVSSVAVGSLSLFMLDEWSMPDNLHDCLYIALNGVCGSLGQWFMTSALKVEQSGLISLARTFDIEVAFLYSALLLGEEIRTTSLLGSVLVSLGVITVVIPKWLGCAKQASRTSDDDDEAGDLQTAGRNDDASSSSSADDLDAQRHHTTTTSLGGAADIPDYKTRLDETLDARLGPINCAGVAAAR